MAVYSATCARALRCNSGRRIIRCPVSNGRLLQSRGVSSDPRALPKLVQPSVWHSIVPRALRSRLEKAAESNQKRAPNPASYFIWIYLLIGSQAIRILQLQNEFNTFMRRADLKIEKLREVVEALQSGDEIDVEKVLGTGDETQEREWEDALREIEDEDRVWQTNRQKRREAKAKASEDAAREAEKDTASPVNSAIDEVDKVEEEAPSEQDSRPRAPGFY